MSSRKFKPRVILPAMVIILIAAAVLVSAIHNNKPQAATTNANSPSTVSVGKTNYVKTADYTFVRPGGWYLLPKAALDNAAATSGIGHGKNPDAFLYVSTDSSSNRPTTINQLKTVPLATIKKIPGFDLLESSSIKIDNQTGQQFTYLTGTTIIAKNRLIAVTYKDKVYLLLYTGAENQFGSNQADLDSIIASFKFL